MINFNVQTCNEFLLILCTYISKGINHLSMKFL
nr:MAG TPA: hypothetical protein [Bacteriophage sp.]DAW98396.1 MAG TPA: hypothetical protein [Bacteriophage sp.]